LEHEPDFKKILFLTDGSTPSLSAQELTIQLAKKLGSEVTVFHVVTHELMRPKMQDFLVQGRAIPESADIEPGTVFRSEISWTGEGPSSAGAHYGERVEDELTSVYRQQGEEVVADAALAFKEEGLRVEKKVVEHKNIVEAVMEEAEEEDYDVIIMGRSGRKEKEARLGGVAEKVSRHSEIPVLIAGEKRAVSKLLVPVDGSESSDKAVKYAASLAKRLGAKLTLLHVQESRLFGHRPELSQAIGKGILSNAAEKLKGMTFDQKLESGDPARKITEIAEKEDYDMIVMGSKGHGAIERFLLGSVINHVLHYTKHPVLVIK
jgi:nucleotide-binding universal stress UspA family protein